MSVRKKGLILGSALTLLHSSLKLTMMPPGHSSRGGTTEYAGLAFAHFRFLKNRRYTGMKKRCKRRAGILQRMQSKRLTTDVGHTHTHKRFWQTICSGKKTVLYTSDMCINGKLPLHNLQYALSQDRWCRRPPYWCWCWWWWWWWFPGSTPPPRRRTLEPRGDRLLRTSSSSKQEDRVPLPGQNEPPPKKNESTPRSLRPTGPGVQQRKG